MNKTKKLSLIVIVCLVVSVVLASATQAQNCLPFRSRSRLASRLLRRPQVQQELKLNTEQQDKLKAIRQQLRADTQALYQGLSRDERQAKRAELQPQVAQLQQQAKTDREAVLTDAQRQRLSQISLQFLGAAALSNTDTARQLQLTSAQQRAVTEAGKDLDTGRQAVNDKLRDGKLTNQQAQVERVAVCRKAEQKLLDILTPEQHTTFETLQGPPSKFVRLRRGG